MKTYIPKQQIDVCNTESFKETVWACVEKSIDACNSCGATYDEQYLYNKWERRLLGAYTRECSTNEQLMAYAEREFVF
jgi:hypothetical protein